MAVRRFFAVRKRSRHQNTWPIDASAGDVPAGWSGWPNNKQFAFLLSHDVETQLGYDKLDQLLRIEETLGFRSVINFIPEGEYRVSENRIQELKQRGFEVGVHGLHHDGKLYNSKSVFEGRATRINRYLKNWDATGFRSPLMHRNLDWIHNLNITYDSSTFDTDPFEPQPDGVSTVFPFFVPKPEPQTTKSEIDNNSDDFRPCVTTNQGEDRSQITNRAEQGAPNSNRYSSNSNKNLNSLQSTSYNPREGYVELPYTLPQDSTLFLLLREQDNRIWKEKTEWIANHGGMTFLNVHPDYIDFSGNGSPSEYQASFYEDFLIHIKETHKDQYWHTTPSELAKYFAQSQEPKHLSEGFC